MLKLVTLLFGGGLFTLATSAFKVLRYVPWQGWVAIGLVVAGVFVYYKGEHAGATRVQDQWDRAAAQAVQLGTKTGSSANAKAEATVPPLTPDQQASDRAIVPRGEPCRVRDPNDRDCAQH